MVSIPVTVRVVDPQGPESKAHHLENGTFGNPWPSFEQRPKKNVFGNLWEIRRDWVNHPIPPPEQLPQIRKVNWGLQSNSEEEKLKWKQQIKATWLGHACFLVEFPCAPDAERGIRVLFDPVWSHRCSPSQLIGPARVTKPPFTLEELPQVDAVVLSHNHYDHTDVTTLKHIYKNQQPGTVHFFAPLGDAKWFHQLGVKEEHVTELDWWQSRELDLKVPSTNKETVEATVRVTSTPCQHFTGRGLMDSNHTLWSSWAIEQVPSANVPFNSKIWFGGDTGYRSVPRGYTGDEDALPSCPAFKEIGNRIGPFDFSMIPIGAYEPRHFMSRVHCSPSDAVLVHQDVKSKQSVGMHWATWVLTCEEMTEPPKKLAEECKRRGVAAGDFSVLDIGETKIIQVAKQDP